MRIRLQFRPAAPIILSLALLAAAPIAAPGATRSHADADTSGSVPASLRLAVARSLAREADAEFRIDARGRGANPRHGLTLAFTPEGARLTGRDGGFALRLERFGRGKGEPVRQAPPRIDGAWVEYDRGRVLSEWFVNLPRGVEQGWTVAERPAGRGPLVLELATGSPPDRVDGEGLAWSGLVYHGLQALDADGRRLPSRWSHEGARLRIEVDDQAAAYPILIDPWVQ